MLINDTAEHISYSEINSINIHMWEGGKGAPLVLIHGFMGNLFDWRLNLFELARHFDVKAFDLPGFGYSGKPADFSYNGEGYARFVTAFLDKFNIQKAVLAGNSLGGQIALEVSMKYPERVSALVLVDSGGYPGSVKYPLFRMLKISVLGEAMMAIASPLVARHILGNLLKNRSLITDDIVDYYYSAFRTAGSRRVPPIVVRNMAADEKRISGEFGRISCPVLILWGAQDHVIPVRYAHILNRMIAGSKLQIIDNAGHLPQLDRAEAVNQAIIEFMRM